jgi:hypothetical protein
MFNYKPFDVVLSGHCVVDETEKGWFIQFIDRDWEAIKKQEALHVSVG